MDVYAQPTCVNLTLCSLLTSLLSRSLRSEFTDAIERKADVLSTNRTYINEAGDQLHVGLIFAGPSIIIDNLARLAPKFSRMHVFDVATVPMQTRTGLPSGASVMKALQAVQ